MNATDEMTFVYKQWISGEWCDASDGATWSVVNPATEEIVREVPFGNGDDARQAIDAARDAFPVWRDLPAVQRGVVLKRAAELMRERSADLARTTTIECGKPLAEARAEWMAVAELFEWYAEEGKRVYGRVLPAKVATRRSMVLQQPLGVVGVIVAWNFPAYNLARACAAALAAGCTVVARGSEYTPMTGMEMAAILAAAGLPGGVLNLINGEPEAMGAAMLDHPECRKISFTGSPRVGRILMDGASKTMTRLSLELGGNAPVLIFPDADLEALAVSSVRTRFRNNGQVCISPQRFLVHQSVHDEFVERAAKSAKQLRLGNGLERETQVGPLINAQQRDRVAAMVDATRDLGGEFVTGGTRPDAMEQGYFYQPTVVASVPLESPLYREEIFGPVMTIRSFDDVDAVIAEANDTSYGLSAYVWTNDLKTAVRCYEALEFGLIGVNDWLPHSAEAPFPGWKQSGLGAESGPEGLEENLEHKTVTLGNL